MKILLAIFLLQFTGCGSSETYTIERESPMSVVITGEFDRTVVNSDDVSRIWYEKNYSEYRVDSTRIAEIGRLQENIRYVIVAGTWCGDSKRQLPRLFKIFDAAHISEKRVKMFGVDRSKKSDKLKLDQYSVQYVPTIIVFRHEREIGRIVESPVETLEADLVSILRNP
ncbi:MAG: thioredoxin family protein [Bacteroidota bacterium]